jgi:hypothetical protein
MGHQGADLAIESREAAAPMKRQGNQVRVRDLPVASQPSSVELAGGCQRHIVLPKLVMGQRDNSPEKKDRLLRGLGIW